MDIISDTTEKKKSILRPLVYIIFVVGSLLPIILFRAGWEFLFFVPILFILLLVVIKKEISLFKKCKASYSIILSTLFVIIFSLISLRLNTLIMTDGPSIYWPSFFFGGLSEEIKTFNSPLFQILIFFTIVYFFSGLFFLNPLRLAHSSRAWLIKILIIFFGVLIIIIHFIPLIIKEPNLLKGKAPSEILYIYSNTFIDRHFSYFSPGKLSLSESESECPYAQKYFNELTSLKKLPKNYRITCKKRAVTYSNPDNLGQDIKFVNLPYDLILKGKLKGLLYVPLRLINEPLTGYPTDIETVYNSGDVIAVTVKIPKDVIFEVDVPGNGTVFGLNHNKSSDVWLPRPANDVVLTLFYPINKSENISEKIKWLNIIFDPAPGSLTTSTLLEVAIIKQSK